jgi:hypothetical protein
MLDELLPFADTEAAAADEPVCVFSEVGILAPRGRFDIEMHLGYLQLGGQVRHWPTCGGGVTGQAQGMYDSRSSLEAFATAKELGAVSGRADGAPFFSWGHPRRIQGSSVGGRAELGLKE